MWKLKHTLGGKAANMLAAALIPLLSLFAGGTVAAQERGSCADTGMKKITRLGLKPVSKVPIESLGAMSDYFQSIRPAVDTIMARKGMSDRADELFQALSSGEGVSEGELRPGDVIEWMIFRQDGKVSVGPGPYCIDTPESYAAFQVDLVDKEDLGGTIRETTTTFLIPKICANLAFVGSETETMAKPEPREPAPPPKPPAAPTPPPQAPPVPVAPEEPEPEPADSRWTVRGFPLRMDVDDDRFATDDGTERTHLTTSSGNGAGLNVEYRPNPRLGIEGGLLYSELDSMLVFDSPTEWLMAKDSSSLLVLTLGANFHLTPGKRADFYVGPFIGLAQVGDPSFNLGGTVGTVSGNFDDEFVFGGQLGLDIPFGESPWAFHLGALYMDLGVGEGGVDLDLNPLIGAIGLAYNF